MVVYTDLTGFWRELNEMTSQEDPDGVPSIQVGTYFIEPVSLLYIILCPAHICLVGHHRAL